MCREMEEIRNEGLTEGELERARQIAIRLSKSKMSIEEIADTVGESVQFVKSWLSKSVASTCQEKNEILNEHDLWQIRPAEVIFTSLFH